MMLPPEQAIGPTRPSDELPDKQAIRAVLDRCNWAIEDTSRALLEQWMERAGPHAQVMRNDREAAIRLLDHADPEVRMAATEAFNYCWPLDRPVADKIASFLHESSVEEEKRVALHVLEKGVSRDRLDYLTGLFVRVVSDEAQSEPVRCDACNMLAHVAAKAELDDIAATMDIRRLMAFPHSTRHIERIEDIDWDLVQRFRGVC